MAEQLTLELHIERPPAPAPAGRKVPSRFTPHEQRIARHGIARARQALAEAAAAARRERAERARQARTAA